MQCNNLLEDVSAEYQKQQSIIQDLLHGKLDGKEANKLLQDSLDKVDSYIDSYEGKKAGN